MNNTLWEETRKAVLPIPHFLHSQLFARSGLVLFAGSVLFRTLSGACFPPRNAGCVSVSLVTLLVTQTGAPHGAIHRPSER